MCVTIHARQRSPITPPSPSHTLSTQYTGVKYILAQLDYMQEEATDISYTPTYAIHNHKGRKVDEFFGVNPQKLDDHLWLHS